MKIRDIKSTVKQSNSQMLIPRNSANSFGETFTTMKIAGSLEGSKKEDFPGVSVTLF
jgi:hypothetical protein